MWRSPLIGANTSSACAWWPMLSTYLPVGLSGRGEYFVARASTAVRTGCDQPLVDRLEYAGRWPYVTMKSTVGSAWACAMIVSATGCQSVSALVHGSG